MTAKGRASAVSITVYITGVGVDVAGGAVVTVGRSEAVVDKTVAAGVVGAEAGEMAVGKGIEVGATTGVLGDSTVAIISAVGSLGRGVGVVGGVGVRTAAMGVGASVAIGVEPLPQPPSKKSVATNARNLSLLSIVTTPPRFLA